MPHRGILSEFKLPLAPGVSLGLCVCASRFLLGRLLRALPTRRRASEFNRGAAVFYHKCFKRYTN